MFDKFKQLKQLRDLQNSLSKEKAEVEKEGIKVVVNGKMEFEEIKLNPELDKVRQEKILKDCINEAMSKIKMMAAQKMSQIQGIGV